MGPLWSVARTITHTRSSLHPPIPSPVYVSSLLTLAVHIDLTYVSTDLESCCIFRLKGKVVVLETVLQWFLYMYIFTVTQRSQSTKSTVTTQQFSNHYHHSWAYKSPKLSHCSVTNPFRCWYINCERLLNQPYIVQETRIWHPVDACSYYRMSLIFSNNLEAT